MTMLEKLVKVLENLRSAKEVNITIINTSVASNNEMFEDTSGYDIVRSGKRVITFSEIPVIIDPYVRTVWIEVNYSTHISKLSTITIQQGNLNEN